ncbi:MAG: hypothetical protein ACLQUY_16020 [Ktedonobacterales bacterium]
MSKEHLLQELADAYEQVIAAATVAAHRGVSSNGDEWGPREIVAHLAGWEMMATVRIPYIVSGMAPLEESDETRQTVMNDAINATIVTLVGEQPLDAICGILRRAYQRDLELLRSLDESFFQPGEYVNERTKGAIEHCQEHLEVLVRSHPDPE